MTIKEAVADLEKFIEKKTTLRPAFADVIINALAERSWIPVSSGDLPKTSDYVLCCTITQKGVKSIVRGYYDPALERWCCGMNSNVIAWMNMPPEYKGE